MGEAEPRAALVVRSRTARERVVPIDKYIMVGRHVEGLDEAHRLVLEDDAVSRRHLEVRLDAASDCARVVDFSTNGTRLNGVRLEHATPALLRPGDRLLVGAVELEFCSVQFAGGCGPDLHATARGLTTAPTALVVGDIVESSKIAECTESQTLFRALDRLFTELRALVVRYHGTVISYPGDALFVAWEIEHLPDAPAHAVEFALGASEQVRAVAPELPLRDPAGGPMRMGWAVALGDVAVSSLTGAHIAVIGDTANVAFRVAGIAGRKGRPDVLVTDTVLAALGEQFRFDAPESVHVKGRSGSVRIFGLRALS